ncbi:RNA-directed DNA polymerase [Brevibacterium casei]|uniref:RNA-directed DNA polymerase n=1 Tax=Brevibacterium casei TaxID=33889 RepID=UPI0028AF22CD|nr:RNA-directed DNA polymerase [Brevibacterium casei]
MIFKHSKNYEAVIDIVQDIVKSKEHLSKALGDTPPVNQSSIYPAGFNGYRWVTKIDPLWNIVYLTLAIYLARKAEGNRVPTESKIVFSHRFNEDKKSKDLFIPGSWKQFIDQSKIKADGSKYVLILDLADFYSRIYLHRLENEIERVSPGTGVAKMVEEILSSFNTSRSFGIPIGGPASRIMSEILLNASDKFLQRHMQIDFVRYADDYRVFVDSIDDANYVTSKLSEFFFEQEGLSLQKHKTRVVTSSDYSSSLDYESAEHGSAQHFLGVSLYYDPYNPNADDDYDTLKSALEDFDILGLLDAELTKGKADLAVVSKITKSLHAMPPHVKTQACRTMLENTDKLYPVLPKILRMIWGVAKAASESGETDEASQYVEAVRAAVREDRYIYNSEISVAYCCRIIGTARSVVNEEALGNIYGFRFGASNEPSTIVQTEIMRVMSDWEVSYWLLGKRARFGSLHPRLQEEFYRATYVLGDEGSHWRSHNDGRIGEHRKPFVKRIQ